MSFWFISPAAGLLEGYRGCLHLVLDVFGNKLNGSGLPHLWKRCYAIVPGHNICIQTTVVFAWAGHCAYTLGFWCKLGMMDRDISVR